MVSLPQSGGTRPATDSLSPNRSETSGSTEEPIKSPPDAQPQAATSTPPAAALATAATHLHSRSASLDGGDVCPPSDSAVSAPLATQNTTTTTTTSPPVLAPLSISNNPVVAVTVDGATPPVVAIPAPQFPTVASQSPPAGSLEPTVEPEPPKVFLIDDRSCLKRAKLIQPLTFVVLPLSLLDLPAFHCLDYSFSAGSQSIEVLGQDDFRPFARRSSASRSVIRRRSNTSFDSSNDADGAGDPESGNSRRADRTTPADCSNSTGK